MMIRIMYSDGNFDMVRPNMLDDLLEKQKVTSFKRSSGWAVVGRDQIRSKGGSHYRGSEKRMT